MKTITMWSLVAALLVGPGAVRGSDEDLFWGALLGAGAGWIMAESVDGVQSSVAVPIGAMAGGLIGHELDRASYRYKWDERYPSGHRYHHRRPYGYYGYHMGLPAQRVVKVMAPRTKAKAKAKAKAIKTVKAPDYHPGVDVVKVEIQLVTGARMDVRLLRLTDGSFVGPQGEKYATLPRAAELSRYSGALKRSP
ncbi:MAG: hypothetical protein HN919_18750 [Verrucomicrobia bacterium]|jgi:hypothetical protein|nr:hypothetical protein [Verrucomicrobiota bacterium]MBT7068344.1 hypothetical protein [Verrucomicrobiota bacterium]MBT7700847.1 hypothetical protein [Verrucomicrobiota bacterium]